MPQDQTTKQAYEHSDKLEKLAREEEKAEDQLNASVLHSDNHTGQQGVLSSEEDAQTASENKHLYALLPDFHKDELRRIRVVPTGTRLKAGGVYADLRFRESGELTAKGEEEVHDELLVAKNEVDYEIWNKLLRKQIPSE